MGTKPQAEIQTVIALAEKAELTAREVRNAMMRQDYGSAIAFARKLGAISGAIAEIIDDSVVEYESEEV